MENTYSKESIKEMILRNENIQSFISNPTWCVDIYYLGVPIRITKEEIGSDYYFHLPYCEGVDYSKIYSFMDTCVKVIGELIEEKRTHNLLH